MGLASSPNWDELSEQFGSVRKNSWRSSHELNWTVQTAAFSSEELPEQSTSSKLVPDFHGPSPYKPQTT